ncbi:helix-turn-helix domain-containing protein [Gellertiella hungarica]|uniref:DNA-binding XRE family transcriptional regulator n=1 Tax=Gellertiella hungarica TaxID=1572859 RepID=A0A7W6J4B0_9HYPH|nr:helix-turn-helix transcriptional regulator [Gellertiella hungarica]MBB4064497.1 DNA-binding XRE family transcriptional regulator [Gellertiella hungarica]
MSGIQRIEIDGRPYVLLSEEDYEDMIDMIDTIEAQAIMARIAAGEETWPHELVVELMSTDSRIRTYRTYRGMSVSELAAAAGISQPYLSEIENGRKTGSVDVLRRIAAALRVELDDIAG